MSAAEVSSSTTHMVICLTTSAVRLVPAPLMIGKHSMADFRLNRQHVIDVTSSVMYLSKSAYLSLFRATIYACERHDSLPMRQSPSLSLDINLGEHVHPNPQDPDINATNEIGTNANHKQDHIHVVNLSLTRIYPPQRRQSLFALLPLSLLWPGPSVCQQDDPAVEALNLKAPRLDSQVGTGSCHTRRMHFFRQERRARLDHPPVPCALAPHLARAAR